MRRRRGCSLALYGAPSGVTVRGEDKLVDDVELFVVAGRVEHDDRVGDVAQSCHGMGLCPARFDGGSGQIRWERGVETLIRPWMEMREFPLDHEGFRRPGGYGITKPEGA